MKHAFFGVKTRWHSVISLEVPPSFSRVAPGPITTGLCQIPLISSTQRPGLLLPRFGRRAAHKFSVFQSVPRPQRPLTCRGLLAIMRHLRLSVLSVLSAALLSGPTFPLRVPSPRQDMVVKHKWDVIPDNWISQGLPPDDTTIDLYIALQPKHKNALTDVLHEISQPGHPK